MKWGQHLRSGLLITVTCILASGIGLAQGLQPIAPGDEEFPSLEKLLGESGNLQFAIDWEFFARVDGAQGLQSRSSNRLSPNLDFPNFKGLELVGPSAPVLHLNARDTSADGRLPQLEMVMPRRLEAAEIDTRFRLELKPLGFSGQSYAQPLAIRYDTELELGRKMGIGSWYSRPVVRINYTRYDFQGERASLERSIPILEWDNGWRLEKAWSSSLKQVVEPRIYYLFVPRVDQDELPNFDSHAQGFGYESLFSPNRLTGRDRIGDTNQASIGVSTSVISSDEEEEYLKAGVAQTVYFSPQASMAGESSDMSDRGISDLASIVRARVGDTSIVSVMQWDPIKDELAAARAELSQAFGHQVLSLMHRKEGEQRFTEFAWDYRISRHLAMTSRLAHRLGEHPGESLQALMTYQGCGWSILMDGRREWRGPSGRYDHSMNVLLVLDSLSEPVAVMCR